MKKMKKVIICCVAIILFASMVASAQNKNSEQWVDVDNTESLIVIKPNFSSVDMAFGDESPKSDENVIACFGAAFTGERLTKFSHKNIAGAHAGGGKKYNGYDCKRNTGAFVSYNGTWHFYYGGLKNKNYLTVLAKAAKNHGCGFEQEMMIFNKEKVKTTRPLDNVNVFRALCEKDGQLMVIESNGMVKFGDFINKLLAYGVKHALYMDMGTWWYGWYRPKAGSFVDMNFKMHNYHTNWLIFKRK